MIEEIYPMYCIRGLSKFPEMGNPRTRQFDLFRARNGSVVNTGRVAENWANDCWSNKIVCTDLNSALPIMHEQELGIVRFISNRAVLSLRRGDTDDPIVSFEDAVFIIKSNGIELYRFVGWDDLPREIMWRMQGGETISLIIFSPTGIVIEPTDYFYLDLVIFYEPQALILDKEEGSVDVRKI